MLINANHLSHKRAIFSLHTEHGARFLIQFDYFSQCKALLRLLRKCIQLEDMPAGSRRGEEGADDDNVPLAPPLTGVYLPSSEWRMLPAHVCIHYYDVF